MEAVLKPDADSYVVHPEHKPRFKLGQKAWFIRGRHAHDAIVQSIVFDLCVVEEKEPPVLICTGYKLNTFNFDAPDTVTFRPYELYETEAAAKQLATWHAVIDISPKEWFGAIGNRKNPDSLEDCELAMCCDSLSHARDLLRQCKKEGGLIERDVHRLVALIQHGHSDLFEIPGSPRPILKKIFAQLGIQTSPLQIAPPSAVANPTDNKT